MTYNAGAENWLGFSLQLFYPENVPLWYVRDLMLMCVISPLVFVAVRRVPALVLPVLALLFVLGIGNGWRGFSNSALLFFSLGGFFAVRRIDLPLWAYMRRGVLIPAALALWVAVVRLAEAPFVQQFQQLFYLAASFATLSLAYALSVREPSPLALRLSESSFFVYALHMVTFGTSRCSEALTACSLRCSPPELPHSEHGATCSSPRRRWPRPVSCCSCFCAGSVRRCSLSSPAAG